jgi:hypothetical protein
MTALEYLIKNMPNISELPEKKKREIEKLFLEAKEMEREQIIDSYQTSHISMMTAEQYFNETYRSGEAKTR